MFECPKCEYVRQPGDYAPPGECPKCGIIYDKFTKSLTDYSERADPVYSAKPVEKSKAVFKGVAIALVVLAVLAVGAFGAYRYLGEEGEEEYSDEPVKVVIFSTPRCKYCKLAKAYFEKNDIEYLEYDVTKSQEGQREFQALRGRGFPLILIGDRRIEGFSEAEIRNALELEGLL